MISTKGVTPLLCPRNEIGQIFLDFPEERARGKLLHVQLRLGMYQNGGGGKGVPKNWWLFFGVVLQKKTGQGIGNPRHGKFLCGVSLNKLTRVPLKTCTQLESCRYEQKGVIRRDPVRIMKARHGQIP